MPIDDKDGGCDTPGDVQGKAWFRQHPGITVDAKDLVSDRGAEIYNAVRARGIETLLIMGVHTNMCILNRTFAIKQMTHLLQEIQQRVGPERAERLIYVGHQANLTMLEAVCRRAKIAPERHYANIAQYGNQAAAGAPVVLSQNWDRFQDGDLVAVVVVGSGLSWSSSLFEFKKP